MKGIKLLFVVCLAFLGIDGAWADDNVDTARAASRRGVVGAPTMTAATRTAPQTGINSSATKNTSASRINSSKQQSSQSQTTTARTATSTRTGASHTTTAQPKTIQQRTATTIQPRNQNTPVTRQTRSATTTQPKHSGVETRTQSANPARPAVSRAGIIIPAAKSATQQSTRRLPMTSTNNRRVSRAATDDPKPVDAIGAINTNYKKCKEIFFECMDEFCANKDAELKRCACSTRIHEFDGVKAQLAKVEDKLLDFNQRLLTVSMDAEDAMALNTETEGEAAFNQADKSASKKMLDDISKKLNATFSDDNTNQSLNAISLTLDVDSAFDSIDSMMGASTTTKSGTALYNAALPVCREMAAEVCTDDDLPLVESGYQMVIEQDCNTVAKAYETQTENARTKIREGSALLDMSRLDTYQQQNSDDILTCKKKMLDMLTDTTVCGDNLSKCLDTTGQYIDPLTGEAVLTVNLANLSTLITRPTDLQSWAAISTNQPFVSYLNSKRNYIESATENCKKIADNVWTGFIEDALAQIKLAQEKKLETIRRGCTALTAQCLADTAKSIEDFDSRALSIFGVAADKTVNEMCTNVRTACSALLDDSTAPASETWSAGVTEIASSKTYDTIIRTCREVGRSCIIQACTSTSGKFGLCMENTSAVYRDYILNRSACWKEVQECVAAASTSATATDLVSDYAANSTHDDPLQTLMAQLKDKNILQNDTFYTSMYSTTPADNPCADVCSSTTNNSRACHICRLSEKIWGNCANEIGSKDNTIVQPKDDNDTLLYWFGQNTTNDKNATSYSCDVNPCPAGLVQVPAGLEGAGMCVPQIELITTGYCKLSEQFSVTSDVKNCCTNGHIYDDMCVIPENAQKKQPMSVGDDTLQDVYLPANQKLKLMAKWPDTASSEPGTFYIGCLSSKNNSVSVPNGDKYKDTTFPSGYRIDCDGNYLLLYKPNGDNKLRHLNPGAYFQQDETNGRTAKAGTGAIYNNIVSNRYTTADSNNSLIHYEYTIKGKVVDKPAPAWYQLNSNGTLSDSTADTPPTKWTLKYNE